MLVGQGFGDLVGAAGNQIALVGEAEPVDVAAFDGGQVEDQLERGGFLGLDAIFGADRGLERVAGVAGAKAVAIEILGDRMVIDLAAPAPAVVARRAGPNRRAIRAAMPRSALASRASATIRAVAADLHFVSRAEGAAVDGADTDSG